MVSVVLLMAGKGSRMGAETNKVLLPLGNRLMFEYPLQLFLRLGCEVVCVISKEDEEEIKARLPETVKYTYGGSTRQESVRNGLNLCTASYVLIHDAARALLDEKTVKEIIKISSSGEAVLVYQEVKDTIKQVCRERLQTLPRNTLISAATPQSAPLSVMKEVHWRAYEESWETTDDISLIEKYRPDIKINLVLSNAENFKITTPLDYKLAKLLAEVEK